MSLYWEEARLAVEYVDVPKPEEAAGYAPGTMVVSMRDDQVNDPEFADMICDLVRVRTRKFAEGQDGDSQTRNDAGEKAADEKPEGATGRGEDHEPDPNIDREVVRLARAAMAERCFENNFLSAAFNSYISERVGELEEAPDVLDAPARTEELEPSPIVDDPFDDSYPYASPSAPLAALRTLIGNDGLWDAFLDEVVCELQELGYSESPQVNLYVHDCNKVMFN